MSTIKDKILHVLQDGGSVRIIGMASRTGSESNNLNLSKARANSALAYLRQMTKVKFTVVEATGVGTRVAINQKQEPNTENERYRSVYISIWNKPDPPPPPPPIKLPDGRKLFDSVTPDVNPDTDGPLDTVGKVLDITSFLASLGELGSGAATLGELLLADLFSGVGGILGILSAVISLPGAWIGQDKVARLNGYCRGYWDAYQDMADAFKNSDLDTKPLDQWPSVPVPLPHFSKQEPVLQAAKAERQGWQDGCADAYKSVMALEKTPKAFKTPKGDAVPVSGKILLRVLSKTYGSNVGEAVKKQINKKLKEKGQSEWPVH